MDSFTLAVVIGIGIVVVVFVVMMLFDKDLPADRPKSGK